MKLRPEDASAAREILGYLNFSGGRPDPSFQRLLNDFVVRIGWTKVQPTLKKVLQQLAAEAPAFHDGSQAEAALDIAFEHFLPRYREFHADLLAHLTDAEFQQPLFLARVLEVILEQGGPWDETDRIVRASLDRLNDFLGYRPVAVLENGRRMMPYPHERLRPYPLYIRGAGVAHGPYREVVSRALELLRSAPEDLLADSYFTLEQMDELAFDPRAHDHLHPANKRTNYLFGEWDPQQIDLKGNYRRFIIRKVILDALLTWMADQKRVATEEVLFDAAAVLCGTILMASAISGAGPGSHDSTVSLTSLLPRVARQRDAFYARLLGTVTGARAKRLQKHAKTTQQPFGHVRQYLNFYLAQYGTQQVQRRQVAYLFARMAYPLAARRQAAIIPCAAARFECEIQWRLAAVRQSLDAGEVPPAMRLLADAEDHLHRGISCGAIVDPWNILGFQGQFPLFSAREDSVPDQRVETLLQIVENLLDGYSRLLEEAAVRAEPEVLEQVRGRYTRFAEFWDRFGSSTVQDLPVVVAHQHLESASHVAQALAEWRAAGEASGNIAFWREKVAEFNSAQSYAQVVAALLDRKDHVAALGLLMQWFSQADEVGLQAGPLSFDRLLVRTLDVISDVTVEQQCDPRPTLRRLFAYLEANAGAFWDVPTLTEAAVSSGGDWPSSTDDPGDEEDDDGGVFGAAYEGMTFRDSADDGQMGEIADERSKLPDAGEFEEFEKRLEPRLQFLRTLAQLWQSAAALWVRHSTGEDSTDDSLDVVRSWRERAQHVGVQLRQLINELAERQISAPPGDHDSNVEYDAQLQAKLYLIQTSLVTAVGFRMAEWMLQAALPDEPVETGGSKAQALIAPFLCHLIRGDVTEVRKQLPGLLRALKKEPLLYVPLDHGGDPWQILSARTMQALLRQLLRHLPRLGLLRETWHLLRTAHQMERASRPQGLAVTEFDRLFRIALKSSLESLVQASGHWKSGRFNDEELIELVGQVVELYLEQWLEHSGTMRLSGVEALKLDGIWESARKFIQRYGGDLFHARQLTLGNVRAILHQGVEPYLDYLAENADPLHPIKLLEDIEADTLSREEAVEQLQLIYQIVVERYDRFLEYNTTTTQSDYGEVFFSLLDFLRLETAYDRDAWNLLPVSLAHEVLARMGNADAAQIWEDVFTTKTEDIAQRHLADLQKLERRYGMRLPSVTNHLQERFVKPLAVNNMAAQLRTAVEDAREAHLLRATENAEVENPKSLAFQLLERGIDEYLRTTSGSGLEIPAWLRQLEDELNQLQRSEERWQQSDFEPELRLPPCSLNLREMRTQLRQWKEPLTSRKKK